MIYIDIFSIQALMATVEFLVFDLTTKQYFRYVYLEAYYFIVLSYLLIVLYGYTWFSVAPILVTVQININPFALER